MAKRKSIFMTVGRIVFLFVMGLVVATVVAFSQVNLETLRGNVLAILESATGVPVEIDGGVSWKLSLRPRIELNQVRVRNADWARHEYAFSAEKVDVTLNLMSLFQSRPTIQNVKIYDATVAVEQNDSGEYSIRPFEKKVPDVAAEIPATYPFEDPGLGGVEVKNLVAHVLGDSFSVAGFNVRYMPRMERREYVGWVRSDDDVFPFILEFSQYNPERKIYPVRLAFSTGGDALIANVALEGTSKMPIDFIVKGDIPDIAAVGEILNIPLAQMPAMKVDITGGWDRKKLSFRKSSIVVRGNKISFAGDVDWARPVLNINADIASKSINLMEIFPEMYVRGPRPNRELNVFKDIPLFGKELRGVNLNLGTDIKKLIVYRDLALTDVDLQMNLKDGHGHIGGDVGIGGGNVEIGADVDIDNAGRMNVVFAADGHDVSVGTILFQTWHTDFISELPTDIKMYVHADGNNLAELMQTITGPVQVKSSGAGYAHSALVANMYGTDFLTSLRHGIEDLFSSEKRHDQIKISCVAVNTKLRNGVAQTRQGVAVQTNAINVRLAGDINLGGETMHLALTTVPVRGLKLSLTGNLVNSMEITGSLARPSIKISGAAVAGKVASATGIGLLLAPLTGGISLVAGAGLGLVAGDLLENWLADVTPCETAMKRGAPELRDDPEWLNLPIDDLISGVLNKQ